MPITSQSGNYSTRCEPGSWKQALGPSSVHNSASLAAGRTWEIYASNDTTTPIAHSGAPGFWDVDIPGKRVFVPASAPWLNRLEFAGGPMYVVVTSTFEVSQGVNCRVSANLSLIPEPPQVNSIAIAPNGDYYLGVLTQGGPNITSCKVTYGYGGAVIVANLPPGQVSYISVPRAVDGWFNLGQIAVVPSATLEPEMRSERNTDVYPPARIPYAPSGLKRFGVQVGYEHFPGFSWTFSDPEPGDYQSAYRLIFSLPNGTLVYDSGYIPDSNPNGFSPVYIGTGSYLLSVRVKDSHGIESPPATLAITQLASVPFVRNLTLSGGFPTGDRTPAFTWAYDDQYAGDPQASWRLAIQRVSDGVILYDTGVVAGTANTHEVATPLAVGLSYRALVTVADNTGEVSATAQVQFDVVNTAPLVSNLAITGGTPTFNPKPAFTWAFSDADGDPQASWRLVIRRASDNGIAYDSGVVAGAASGATLPTALPVGASYAAQVLVADSLGGAGSSSSLPFTVADDRPFVSNLAIVGGTPTNDTTPDFTWAFTDPLGVAQGWYRLEVLVGGATVYDSGQVASSSARAHTVATPLLRGPQYTARLTIQRGRAAATLPFTIPNALPVLSNLVLTGGVVGGGGLVTTTDTTPAFTWNFADADGEAQASFALQVLARERNEVVLNSGTVASAAHAYELLSALEDDDFYRAVLTAYDPNGGGALPLSVDFDIPFDTSRVILAPLWQAPPHNTSVVPRPYYLFRVPGDVGGPRRLEFELEAAPTLDFAAPSIWAKTRRSRAGWSFTQDAGVSWAALPPRLPEGNPGGASARWVRFQPVTAHPLGYVFVRPRALVM